MRYFYIILYNVRQVRHEGAIHYHEIGLFRYVTVFVHAIFVVVTVFLSDDWLVPLLSMILCAQNLSQNSIKVILRKYKICLYFVKIYP